MRTSTKRTRLTAIVATLIALFMAISMLAACGGSGISLDKTEHTMYIAENIKLNATAPEGAEIDWSSSDESVATVRRGTVTAKAVGTATITASLESGASATCKITVLDRTVTISQKTATIDLDSDNWTVTLTAECSDGGAVTWTSENTSLAIVNGGVVTATGDDIGDVRITAQRGAAQDTCVVTIKQDSRPADFRRLEAKTNKEVIDSPGTWFYHSDGSSSVSYRQRPWYGNGGVGVTFEVAPNLASGQYFNFRYQPYFAAEDVAEENKDEFGRTLYAFTATITVSVDADVRIVQPYYKYTYDEETGELVKPDKASYDKVGKPGLLANTPKEVTYFGVIDDAEPLSIRIDAVGDGVENLNGVSFTVENITVRTRTADEVAPVEPPIPQNPGDVYELTYGDRASTTMHPGRWYYMIDSGSFGVPELDGMPTYDHGTLTMKLTKTTTGATYQLRTQPLINAEDPLEDIGYLYTVNLTVNISAAASLIIGRDGATKTFKEVPVGEDYDISVDCNIDASYPFYVQLKAEDPSLPITLVVKNIEFVEREVDYDQYELAWGGKATTVADPGKWYYMIDSAGNGTDELVEMPTYDHGTLSMKLSHIAETNSAQNNDATYQFRIQPTFAVGTTYTAKLTVKLSAAATLLVGRDGKIITLENVPVDEDYEVIFNCDVDKDNPFYIQIKAADKSAPIEITVTDISFEDTDAVKLSFNSEGGAAWITGAEADGNGVYGFERGDVVTVHVNPEEGYEVASVMKDGVALQANEDGTYTFEVNGDATVVVTFRQIGGEDPGVSTGLEKKTNGETMSDPGNWYYHVDGSDTTFEKAPWQEEDALGVTFDEASNLLPKGLPGATENGSYFYFRYQPTYGEKKGYTISFTATVSADVELRYGQPVKNAEDGNDYSTFTYKAVTANTPVEITYEGVVSEVEPFSIRIDKLGEGLENLNGVTFTISNISITERDIEDETPEVPGETYQLTKAGQADTAKDAGKWHYIADGSNGTDYAVKTAECVNGTLTLAFDWIKSASNNVKFNYQPTFKVGTDYTVTFTINVSVASFIIVGTDKVDDATPANTKNFPNGASSTNDTRFEANKDYTVEFSGTVRESKVFYIQLKDFPVDEAVSMIVKDVEFTAKDSGSTTNNVKLTVGEHGTATLNATAGEGGLYTYESGDTVIVTVQPEEGYEVASVMKDGVALELKDGVYSFEINGDAVVTVTFRLIGGGDGEDETPEVPGESYTLTKAGQADTAKDAGKWHYIADGTNGTDYAVKTAECANGTLTLAFDWIKSASNNVKFNYQPTFKVGTDYTVTFTINVSVASFIIVGTDKVDDATPANTKNFPNGASSTNDTRFEANKDYTVEFSGTVREGKVFYIQLKAFPVDAPVSMVVKNITFTPDESNLIRGAYADYFSIGAAMLPGNVEKYDEAGLMDHFNSITPENDMKWRFVEPAEGEYNYSAADSLVEYAKKNALK